MLDEIKKALGEAIDPLKKQVEGMEGRIAEIEKMPVAAKGPAILISHKEYRGRKLAKQGVAYREMFAKNAHRFPAFSDPEKFEKYCEFMIDVATRKGLVGGTDANGGYTVPDEFAADLIQLAVSDSYALQVARILTMGGDTLKLPKELTRGSVTWESEAATKTASNPTFDQVVLTAKKLFNMAEVSNELLADSEIDIVSLLTRQFAYTQAIELDNQMFNGTGSPVSGVLTAAAGYSVVLSGASMSAITTTNISLAIAKLAQGRRRGARFFVNRLSEHYIRDLKDSQNRPIFAEIGGDVPNTLYRYPEFLSESIADTDGASKAVGVFGNFDYFFLGRRAGSMMIEADPYGLFSSDQTRFRMITRWGMSIADANSFVRIMSGA